MSAYAWVARKFNIRVPPIYTLSNPHGLAAKHQSASLRQTVPATFFWPIFCNLIHSICIESGNFNKLCKPLML